MATKIENALHILRSIAAQKIWCPVNSWREDVYLLACAALDEHREQNQAIKRLLAETIPDEEGIRNPPSREAVDALKTKNHE